MRNPKSTEKGGGPTSAVPDTRTAARDPEGIGLDILAAWVSAWPDGVFVLDSDLRIVYSSPGFCALLGYQPDQLLGQYAPTFIPARH